MRVAALDLGTNTCLCLIADVVGDRLSVVADEERIVRLGEGVDRQKLIQPQAFARLEQCFVEYAELIRRKRVDQVVATATSAARDASNQGELIALGRRHGIPLSVISGEQEARLSFLGTVSDLSPSIRDDILVVDIGGGSTELILAQGGESKARSFNIGTVRLTEMFITKQPVDPVEMENLTAYVKKTFSAFGVATPKTVVSVAGTPVALACILQKRGFDFHAAHGKTLSLDQLRGLMDILKKMSVEERVRKFQLDRRRADVIVAGGVIMEQVLALADADSFLISARGLRYGVALKHGDFQ